MPTLGAARGVRARRARPVASPVRCLLRHAALRGWAGVLATMKAWWGSMAPPTGEARVVLLEADDAMLARMKMHRLKLWRAGEQVLILPLRDSMPEAKLPKNRVLTREELESVNASTVGEEIEAGRWPAEPESG